MAQLFLPNAKCHAKKFVSMTIACAMVASLCVNQFPTDATISPADPLWALPAMTIKSGPNGPKSAICRKYNEGSLC